MRGKSSYDCTHFSGICSPNNASSSKEAEHRKQRASAIYTFLCKPYLLTHQVRTAFSYRQAKKMLVLSQMTYAAPVSNIFFHSQIEALFFEVTHCTTIQTSSYCMLPPFCIQLARPFFFCSLKSLSLSQ